MGTWRGRVVTVFKLKYNNYFFIRDGYQLDEIIDLICKANGAFCNCSRIIISTRVKEYLHQDIKARICGFYTEP